MEVVSLVGEGRLRPPPVPQPSPAAAPPQSCLGAAALARPGLLRPLAPAAPRPLAWGGAGAGLGPPPERGHEWHPP